MDELSAFYPQDPLTDTPKSKATKPAMRMVGVAAAALLVGVFTGIAIGYAPVKGLESDVAYQKNRVLETINTNTETVAKLQAEADAKVSAAEASAVAKESELTERSEALETRESEAKELQETLEAEVVAREESKISTGLHEVGVDVKPGKYKTAGPNGSNSAGCYYAWKTSFGSDADIIDNELTKGKATVVLKKGQFFEVGSCEDFVKQ